MKKKFLALVLISLFAGNAFCDDFTISDAEPYDTKSTPQWLKDMRRAEIITLGSWPFTLLLTAFGFSIGECVIYKSSSYMKNPFVLAGDDYSYSETKKIILTSLGISVGVGAADLIANIAKRRRAARESNSLQLENITITPLFERGGGVNFRGENAEIFFGNLQSAVF